jgi:hypothetical protein
MVSVLAIDVKAVFVRTPPPEPRSTAVIGSAPGRGFAWTPASIDGAPCAEEEEVTFGFR